MGSTSLRCKIVATIWEDRLIQVQTRFLSSSQSRLIQFRKLSKVHGNRRILDLHQCKELEMKRRMKFTFPIKTSLLTKSWIVSCKKRTYQMCLVGKEETMAIQTRYQDTWEGENHHQCRWPTQVRALLSSLIVLRILELSPMDSTMRKGRETTISAFQIDPFINRSSSLDQGW